MPTYFCKDLLHLRVISHTLAVQNGFLGAWGDDFVPLPCIVEGGGLGGEQNCRTVIKLQTLALLAASECHGEP